MKTGIKKRKRIYILTRKRLKNNTRIFKQACSLVDCGFEVVLIGIRSKDLPSEESQDGYRIIRLTLNPLHTRLLHSLRSRTLRAERRLLLILKFFASYITLQPVRSRWQRQRWNSSSLRSLLLPAYPFLMLFRTIRVATRAIYALLRNFTITMQHRVFKPEELRFNASHAKRERRLLIRWVKRLAQEGYRALRFGLRVFLQIQRGVARTVRKAVLWCVRSYRRLKRFVRQGLRRTNQRFYFLLRSALLALRWPFLSIEYYLGVYRYVTQKLPPPDVIQANDLDTLLVAAWLARKYQAKLVYDAQELYTGLHTLPRWYRYWLTLQEFILIRRADKVIAVNDAIANVMERKFRRKIDRVVLNCPPYTEIDTSTGLTIREKLGLPLTVPVYLYSGGLTRQRGIENTVLALKYLERGVLILLGEGSLKEVLLEIIQQERLEGRVYFVDFIPHTEVPRFISSADVGIIPYENVGVNHYLCSPSKLFHYIMAELPVACSDFPFLRKIVVENDVGEVFDPSDPRSIASAIERIMIPHRYQQIKSNLKRVKKEYTWEVEEQKFLAVYRDLLQGEFLQKIHKEDEVGVQP